MPARPRIRSTAANALDDARRAWLDSAVWHAYGWDDDGPSATPEDAIRTRLLALNAQRSDAT